MTSFKCRNLSLTVTVQIFRHNYRTCEHENLPSTETAVGRPRRRAGLEPPPAPLKLGRAGAKGPTPRRAGGVRQWLYKNRLLVGLVLMGVVAWLAHGYITAIEGKQWRFYGGQTGLCPPKTDFCLPICPLTF